jgi:DNA-binding LacI/PurR family transcriptional regulator
LQNPIFPAFAEVIGGALAQNGYTPVLCTQTAGGVSEADYVDILLQQRVSGVVFLGGVYAQLDQPHDHYERLREVNLPTVLVNAPIADFGFATVSSDDAVATQLAMNHLRQLGHTKIGLLVGPHDHIPSQRKLAAASSLADSWGTPIPESDVAHSLFSLEAGQASANKLLASGVTAIVCASDLMALGAIRAIRRAGLRVPEDVSVVGYDDSALMNCTEPPLTTVRQPIESMGRMVIELLIRQISSDSAISDELLFEPELVVRRSTGPLRRRIDASDAAQAAADH